jgi:alcohol dehydrogenase (NADP+)
MSSTSNLPQVPERFQGWVGKDKNAIGNLVYEEYTPKPFTDDDVDIAITHCGVCASDLHTLRSGWGPVEYPQVVGHEIIGVALRVGKNVSHVKVGQRVGVGAQSGSCLSCTECNAHREPYCPGLVPTYNGKYKDGSSSYGGYADFSRAPGHFVIPIPEGLSSAIAAPMLCGGVTVYSPLKQYGAGTERKRVGIIGIGGLGHFVSLLFSQSFGKRLTFIP